MCGITGWVSFDRDFCFDPLSRATVNAMIEVMSSQKADDKGIWTTRHVALGPRSLATIYLLNSCQPMHLDTPEGTLAIIYSGKINNFLELRSYLSGCGHRFKTNSDTEVVLFAYLEWGDSFVMRLNGMYAFAIWDSRSDKLMMVRDRLGIKPLYYYKTVDGVLFGSEPKSILANPLANNTVTLCGLRELFAFGIKPQANTFWENMHEIEPGTIVTVTRAGLRSIRYWTLETQPQTDGKDVTIAHIRELLDDIVCRQLVVDAPPCFLLSGGLDSSVITAIAAKHLSLSGKHARSFAVDFIGQTENFTSENLHGTPDAPYVREMAEHCHTEHQNIMLNVNDLIDPELRSRIISARDIPTSMGDMDISMYLLFQAIRKQSLVAISGEGADELFGGYPYFFNLLACKSNNFPWMAGDDKKRELGDSFLLHELDMALDMDRYIRDIYNQSVAHVMRLDGESDFEWTMRKACYLSLTHFLRILLDRTDRISTAVGLEVRLPFCDHRLVEYVYNTPWLLKTYDGREKSLLRGASLDLIPTSINKRVKSPYPSIQDPAYTVKLRDNIREYLPSSNHAIFDLVNRDWLTRTLSKSVITNGSRNSLERVYDLALWLDIYKPELKLS